MHFSCFPKKAFLWLIFRKIKHWKFYRKYSSFDVLDCVPIPFSCSDQFSSISYVLLFLVNMWCLQHAQKLVGKSFIDSFCHGNWQNTCFFVCNHLVYSCDVQVAICCIINHVRWGYIHKKCYVRISAGCLICWWYVKIIYFSIYFHLGRY